MAENSKIEWTDHTFNPWIGCTKVSDGCKHCYAETLMDKRMGKVQWGPEGTRVRTSAANWKKPLQWNKQAAAEGRRYKVFCASLADVFERNDQLLAWRWELMDLIEQTHNLDWLLLTKRPENVLDMTPWPWHRDQQQNGWLTPGGKWPANVWIGTSDEGNRHQRIDELRRIPAVVRFISMEPLIADPGTVNLNGIHWVIVGGESGHNARPMHPDWARSIRDQCVAAGVAFHFKQWGNWSPMLRAGSTGKMHFWPNGGASQDVGKVAAGRLLDGRAWDEFPAVQP